MSVVVSFLLSFFTRDALDEILNLIESVSEGFPTYSWRHDMGFPFLRLIVHSITLVNYFSYRRTNHALNSVY